jgi:hypothetical protein
MSAASKLVPSSFLTSRTTGPDVGNPFVTAKQIRQLLGQSRILLQSNPSPILAIAGLLNAGKTSLVAGFLSPAGRERLLIGESNLHGTHRFIIWLPESWRGDAELWKSIRAQLETIFDYPPEDLSEDPVLAAKQYNAIDVERPIEIALSTPIIATDAALDQWNIGLMDCPDIQTGITASVVDKVAANAWSASESISHIAEFREKLLSRALRIASAFVVVASANSLQDEYVDRILSSATKAMPGLKKILAVNRVPRRYSVQEISDEMRQGYATQDCWRFYMAYHFDGPMSRERLPAFDLVNSQTSHPSQSETLPAFFRIDHSTAVQPPAEVPVNDYLIHLGSQLEPSQLSRDVLRVTLHNLKHACENALLVVRDYQVSDDRRCQRLQRVLSEACLSLSYTNRQASSLSGQELPLQVSREIVNQVAVSLERTAPWWAKPGRKMTSWIESARQAAGEVTQWVALPNWMSDRLKASSDWVRSRWHRGEGGKVISSHKFYESIVEYDSNGDLILNEVDDRTKFLPRLTAIIDRFQSESRTRLDDSQLDAYTCEMWNRMSWKQRMWTGMAPAGMLFAPLLAVMMLPMDFGGSAVLVFASMKELLIAGAAGVGMAMMNSDQMPKIAEHEAAWQQLSDLVAIACDEFGVPRTPTDGTFHVVVGNVSKSLIPSQLSVRFGSSSDGAVEIMRIEPVFEEKMRGLFSQLDNDLSSGT